MISGKYNSKPCSAVNPPQIAQGSCFKLLLVHAACERQWSVGERPERAVLIVKVGVINIRASSTLT